MRFTQAEKYEIIQLVEGSEIGVNRTLREIGIHKSTFYNWYRRYCEQGFDGLAPKPRAIKTYWNRIPETIRTEVVDLALDYPEASARNLACMITDNRKYYISESSVYRILKERGLITEPAFNLQAAASEFKDKTTGINQLWQTDFTYMKIVGWGWYYLATVLDDYSRFIVHWELCTTMTAADVKRTMDEALMKTKLSKDERPRLLSDNGPCYISEELKAYVQDRKIEHVRGRPNHPQTQGKIERYHRSMKNIIKLDNYYSPGELEERLKEFVHYYNHHRYHESIQNLTPADVYYGRGEKILRQREITKIKTMKKRKQNYLFELMKTIP